MPRYDCRPDQEGPSKKATSATSYERGAHSPIPTSFSSISRYSASLQPASKGLAKPSPAQVLGDVEPQRTFTENGVAEGKSELAHSCILL